MKKETVMIIRLSKYRSQGIIQPKPNLSSDPKYVALILPNEPALSVAPCKVEGISP